MRQRSRPLRGALGGVDVAVHIAVAALRQARLQQFEAPRDAGEQVVEIVRDAARELAHRLHLLGLAEGVLQVALLGHVAPDRVEMALARHRGPGQDAVGPVLVAVAVLEARRRGPVPQTMQLLQRPLPLVGMHVIEEARSHQVLRLPAEDLGPGRVHGLDHAVEARDQHDVLGQAPHPVALARPLGHLRLQALVELAQHVRRLPPGAGELQVRFHPRQELAGREGLRQVIVRAGAHPLDLRLLAGPSREQDDRDGAQGGVGAQGREQAEPVEARHHHVGENEVGGRGPRGPRGREGARAVRDRLDDVAPAGEEPAHVVAHVGVVVGEQHPLDPRRSDGPVADRRHRGLLGRGDGFAAGIGEPARRLLDKGLRARRRRGLGARGVDAVGRQVFAAQRQRDPEGAARARAALDADAAAVEMRQLLHQREADARALEAAPLRTRHPVEALEQARQLRLGNAGSGVAHRQAGLPVRRFQRHPDPAREGELEGIRDQVEDDLLPHLAVDEDRLGEGRAGHVEAEARPLRGRAEARGELGRIGAELRRLEHGLGPPGLDPREVEERVDELQEAQAVAMRDLDEAPVRRHHLRLGLADDLLQGPEHQGQGRPELVADIGEEQGLLAVDLRQRLDPAALLLVGVRVGEPRGDLPGEEIEEAPVALVEGAVGVEPGQDEPGRPVLALLRDRQDEDVARGEVPGPGGQAREGETEIRDRDDRRLAHLSGARGDRGQSRRARGGVAGGKAGAGQEGRVGLLRPGQVGEEDRDVVRAAREAALDHRSHLRDGADARHAGAEVAQLAQAALADDALGLLRDDAEHPGDRAVIIREGRVGEGVVGLLREAAALQEQQQALVPGRLAGGEDPIDARADIGPDLGPDGIGARAERPGFLDAEGRQVGVIAEEDQLRAPGHPHGEAGGQHHPHGGAEGLRPGFHRPQRGRGPIMGAQALSHDAAAGKTRPVRRL
ncbi:hypothetical protein AEGHOMDF_0739 [Methylobacterium soli]|nr:hypothetical protein AEGHOMDF_0739 [Methylobacterium soli]